MASSIDNETWARLSPLLDEALELTPAAQGPWLEELAGAEPELAAALRELLAEKALLDTGSFLEGSPARPAAQATLSGQRFGAYEIESLLGKGGMGTVWLAHRCDGRFEGKAAVKLLNAALIGGPGEQRFVREGSVLAALRHPNIAHLVDAGVAACGQPYLVLEHVEGSPIDAYCDAGRLGIRTRLRVFLEVLDAVAFAHRHLVVHRDLKPSNILVTGDGTVKLLDFGIAALLDPDRDAPGRREPTREIGAALTPEYAAPEQLLGRTVTTATDVYALGRVLYLLLGGTPAADAGRSSVERTRLVEREPPRLSDAVRGAATRRLVRGDLENIVAKALKVEPSERYATVQAFADDLRRHLADEPVSARPDSVGYRFAKFVRRHRGGVLSGTATALALVGITVFAVVQMLEAQHQRDVAEVQRQRAEGYSTSITSLLSQAGPDGGALSANELLSRAAEQVEATYADRPAFLVHMLLVISGRYFDLQDTHNEYATLVRAERVARASGEPLLVFKVQCNTVETELAAGRRQAAERRLQEALGLLPSMPAAPALDHAACLRAQAEMARADSDYTSALGHFEEARRILERSGDTEGNVYSGILSGLAAFNRDAGNVAAAHAYLLQLVELDRRFGREHSVAGRIARISLANSFRLLGQVRRSEEMHRVVAAEAAPVGVAKMMYGQTLARLDRHDEALRLLHDCLAEIEAGGHEEWQVRARLALAESLFLAASLGEAETTLADAVTLMRADETRYGNLLNDARRLRGNLLLATGRVGEAQAEILAGLQDQRARGGDEPRRARLLLAQARIALARGAPTDAAEAARASAELFQRNTPDPAQSADVGEALLVLGDAQAALGDEAAASRTDAQAAAALQNGLGPQHRLTLLALGVGPSQPVVPAGE